VFVDELAKFGRETGDRLCIAKNPTRGEVEALVREHRPDLLVIDTLQKQVHFIGGAGDRHDLKVGRVTAWLAGLALDHDLCSLIVSQISRRSGLVGMPTTGDLRESGAIAEDADVCILAWWPWVDDRTREIGRFGLSVAKNRPGGETAIRAVGIDPETQVLTTLVEFEEERVRNSW
jgi:replicative DNA helicase